MFTCHLSNEAAFEFGISHREERQEREDRIENDLDRRRCSHATRVTKPPSSSKRFSLIFSASGPRIRPLTAIRMSYWNKQIGSDDGVFGVQKGSLDGPPPQSSNHQISPMFTHFR
jgi:hypothetical protein